MAGPRWKNIYRLSDEQISKLDDAEEAMVMMEINRAESILLELLGEDSNCVPVLNNLAHLNGRHLSDFEKAISLLDAEKNDIQNQAMELAKKMYRQTPVIYVANGFEGVAVRFRQQINENSKVLCWHHVIPEMNHNEIEGWNKDQNSVDTIAIWFTDKEVHPRNKKRIEVTSKLLAQLGSQHEIISASGSNRCIRLIKLVQLCDYISFDLGRFGVAPPRLLGSSGWAQYS